MLIPEIHLAQLILSVVTWLVIWQVVCDSKLECRLASSFLTCFDQGAFNYIQLFPIGGQQHNTKGVLMMYHKPLSFRLLFSEITSSLLSYPGTAWIKIAQTSTRN